MLNHDWTLILGCSRQLLAAIRRSIPDAGLDPTASESNRLYLSALRSEICGPAGLVSFWITRDIRSDDGHVTEDEVDALLWLCYQDRPWVRVAAIRLWRCYHETLLPRVRAFVACPQFSEDELVEFERAIELLEEALDVLSIEGAQDDSIAEAVFDASTACPQDGSKELVTYSVSELCKEIGISRPTLNKYAAAAGIPTPGVGKRNHRYTSLQRKCILQAFIEANADKKLVEKCRRLLNASEEKSKDEN